MFYNVLLTSYHKPYSRHRQCVTVCVLENYAMRHWDMSGSQETWYCTSHTSYFNK